MSEPLPTIDYMSQYKGGLPPDSRLRLEQTPVGISITLPPRNLAITLLACSPIFMILGLLTLAIIDELRNGHNDFAIWALLLLPLVTFAIVVIIIRRRRVPLALATAENTLYAITPNQFRLRREFIIEPLLAVRAVNTGLTIAGESPAELIVSRNGKRLCTIFRNLRRSEIDWIVLVINSAVAEKCK